MSSKQLGAAVAAWWIAMSGNMMAQQVPAIDLTKWGAVTAPVYGMQEPNPNYPGADVFAGPNKFGSYYAGVLPNGKIVKPAGISIQVGMNPMGVAVTPDSKFIITSNDDEREGGYASYQSTKNLGGYSISVIDAATMKVLTTYQSSATFYIGLQITGTGPYTIFASGGPNNTVMTFSVSADGTSVTPGSSIVIPPTLPVNGGYVSNYRPDAGFQYKDANGNGASVPSQFSTAGAAITYPAGSTLSPDGKFLYVACNVDNSVAVIDTASKTLIRQQPAGYFPYTVAVSGDGQKIAVSNWGMTEYKFYDANYDSTGTLTNINTTAQNYPDGFYVPLTDTVGKNPKTSSVSLYDAAGGDARNLQLRQSVYMGHPLDSLFNVGDTHPSAMAVVRNPKQEILYTLKSNSDAIGMIDMATGLQLADYDIAPLPLKASDGHTLHGTYPGAIAVSPDGTRAYITEGGLNSVLVLDTTNPASPRQLGRIPTGWYPIGVTVSPDGKKLYITNAKGIGEDINPATDTTVANAPTGVASDTRVDSNFIFGSLQQVDLTNTTVDQTALTQNFMIQDATKLDTSVVPLGGAASSKIKHVFFIIHENKTFDSMLGNRPEFGKFASTTFNDIKGAPYSNQQYTGVSINTQTLATTFAVAANYYADSEESDAGHQFNASGTSTDYTQKTLLNKTGRGLLANKNFEPEDYPESGYIFNNAARNGVSFKDYGAMVRIQGTDTGTTTPTSTNDIFSGNLGFPQLDSAALNTVLPLNNLGDVSSPVYGLGQSYFMALPILTVLGTNNPSGEPRIDLNYPGYNFNISDQRRAQEFITDFDRMVRAGTLPQYIYLYQPNDHTGGVQAPNQKGVYAGAASEVADGDVGLGMVVQHIMQSPVYYDAATSTGSAIFMTYDDAQATLDHIHPHRSLAIVISPFAKPGYISKRHYSTASIVKTEELLLGLPPNNLGDLVATDMRDMFQSTYNGITAAQVPVTRSIPFSATPFGDRIYRMVKNLDLSRPDSDSLRLGILCRLSMQADALYKEAAAKRKFDRKFKAEEKKLLEQAVKVVNTKMPKDWDDK